ncbi:MAG: arylsulfatase [Verrucomicrobiota bacterium]
MNDCLKLIVPLGAAVGLAIGLIPSASAAQPNIVFILADDIGYADISCCGAQHAKTPAIDKLASQGVKFSNAHAPASTCTPTRRAFLTGTYSWRQKPGSSIAPGDAPLSIPVGTATVPSILKQAGYRTGVVGKWHLGLGPEGGPDWNKDILPGPLEIGFDYAFFMPATGDRVPCVYIENHRVVGLDPNDPITISYKQKVGNDPTGKENPELLKLKHTHGHDMTIINGVGRIGWMTGGKAARWKDEDMADTYTQKAISFIENNSQGPFFLYLATHNIHVPRVPHLRFKGVSPSGTRGDAIQELDAIVQRVLDTLDRLKLSENTLVIFTSDNGGVMDDGYEDVGSFNYHPNQPLRGYKGSIWEGGHRVPFIARWPGKIKPASACDALIAHLDMAATFAAITGVNIPAGQCRDSFNVLPALLGEKTDRPVRPHFVAHNGGTTGPFAILAGDWKYLEIAQPLRAADTREIPGVGKEPAPMPKAKGKGGKAPPVLIHLSEDISEAHDLLAKEPAKAGELKELLEKIRAGTRSN